MEFATAPHRRVQMACRMDLFTKARKLGIQTEFVDGQGHRHVTDARALKIILDALPERVPYRFLGEAVVIRYGEPSRTELNEAASLPVHWMIVAGQRVIAKGDTGDRKRDTGDRKRDTDDRKRDTGGRKRDTGDRAIVWICRWARTGCI
jgi:hypothetical protein